MSLLRKILGEEVVGELRSKKERKEEMKKERADTTGLNTKTTGPNNGILKFIIVFVIFIIIAIIIGGNSNKDSEEYKNCRDEILNNCLVERNSACLKQETFQTEQCKLDLTICSEFSGNPDLFECEKLK